MASNRDNSKVSDDHLDSWKADKTILDKMEDNPLEKLKLLVQIKAIKVIIP